MTAPHPNPRLRPVIRVFVSSTFSDMRHERNALQERVYPKLEQFCQKNGFQFQEEDRHKLQFQCIEPGERT